MKTCKICLRSLPEDNFGMSTQGNTRERQKRREECQDCYNRNSKLDCFSCAEDVFEACQLWVTRGLPVLCEHVYEYEKAEFYEQDPIVEGISYLPSNQEWQ